MTKTTPFILAMFLVSWGLTGCASRLSVKTVDPTETVEHLEKEALIFGKIIFRENGEEMVPYGIFRKPALTLLHIESGKQKVMTLQRDGAFYWMVPRGTYNIPDIGYDRCDYLIYPRVTFSIPPEGGAFYLGTLTIDMGIERFLFIRLSQEINSIEVIDEFDVAKRVLTTPPAIEKSLMIPGKFYSVERAHCGSGFPGIGIGFSPGLGGLGNLSGLGGLR